MASFEKMGSKGRDKIVSKDVFLRHIVRKSNGEIDVSGVFSEECFMDWLSTRSEPPKKPEESFRRTLVATVAGKDARQPFEPDIEAKLLERLRKPERWPAFRNNFNGKHRIGERGISSSGYHEQKVKNENKVESPIIQSGKRLSEDAGFTPETKKPKVLKMQPSSNDSGISNSTLDSLWNLISVEPEIKTEISIADDIIADEDFLLDPINDYTSRLLLNDIPVINFSEFSSSPSETFAHDFVQFLYETQNDALMYDQDEDDVPMQESTAVAHYLLKLFSLEELKSMARTAQGLGLELFNQNLKLKIDVCLTRGSPLGIFYSADFLCPLDQAKMFFDPLRPTGRFLRNASGIIMDSDENANLLHQPCGMPKKLGKWSLVGKHSSSMLISSMHQYLAYRHISERMLTNKLRTVFFRNIISIGNDVKIMLGQASREANGSIFIKFQDHTDLFKDYLHDGYIFM